MERIRGRSSTSYRCAERSDALIDAGIPRGDDGLRRMGRTFPRRHPRMDGNDPAKEIKEAPCHMIQLLTNSAMRATLLACLPKSKGGASRRRPFTLHGAAGRLRFSSNSENALAFAFAKPCEADARGPFTQIKQELVCRNQRSGDRGWIP